MSDEDHLRHAGVHRPRDPGEEAVHQRRGHVGAGRDLLHPAERNHALRRRQPDEAVPADPQGEVQLLWRGEDPKPDPMINQKSSLDNFRLIALCTLCGCLFSMSVFTVESGGRTEIRGKNCQTSHSWLFSLRFYFYYFY